MRVQAVASSNNWDLLEEINNFIEENPRYILKTVTVLHTEFGNTYTAWLEIE